MKNNKAPGRDNLGLKLTKYVAAQISKRLQYIYNLSFVQGMVPDN